MLCVEISKTKYCFCMYVLYIIQYIPTYNNNNSKSLKANNKTENIENSLQLSFFIAVCIVAGQCLKEFQCGHF